MSSDADWTNLQLSDFLKINVIHAYRANIAGHNNQDPLVYHIQIEEDLTKLQPTGSPLLRKTFLHPIEALAFSKAMEYLSQDTIPDANSVIKIFKTQREADANVAGEPNADHAPTTPNFSPNNVILVSYFKRAAELKKFYGLKKLKTTTEYLKNDKLGDDWTKCKGDDNKVETHTIALWKTGKREIKIIDPSNNDFSSFLVDKNNNILTNLFLGYSFTQMKATKANKAIPKFYDSSKGRDCVDIAAKIAFELNLRQNDEHSTKSALDKTAEQLSNASCQQEFKWFKSLQSSEPDIRQEAKKIFDSCKKLKTATGDQKTEILSEKDLDFEPGDLARVRSCAQLLGTLETSITDYLSIEDGAGA